MTDFSLFSPFEADPSHVLHLPPIDRNNLTAETLRHFRVFASLDPVHRERLFAQMQLLTVPARTILLAAGQPGHAVYFLLEGTVKIALERPTGPRTQKPFSLGKKEPREAAFAAGPATGTQVMLNLCGPGAILGELSVIDGRGHSANVITREVCRLLWLDQAVFFAAVEEIPQLSLALLRGCSARLRHATRQLHAFATLDAAGRIAHCLLQLAQYYSARVPEGLRLSIGLSQSELADLTGLTRTRVNTVITVFKKNGWIIQEVEGSILLVDLKSLSAAARGTF